MYAEMDVMNESFDISTRTATCEVSLDALCSAFVTSLIIFIVIFSLLTC